MFKPVNAGLCKAALLQKRSGMKTISCETVSCETVSCENGQL